MKIVIFIGGLSNGGAERVACNLANYLSNNHSITMLTVSDKPASYTLNKDIERITLASNEQLHNPLIQNIKRIIRFRKYLKNSTADIYLVMLPKTINLMLLHKHLIKVPIIISERADPKTRYESSKLKKWIMQKLYPKADGYVFQTQEAMNYYRDYIGDKGTVIPNAVHESFAKMDPNIQREKIIVAAGRLTEQKNFQLLINSFSKIASKHSDYNLIIYGEGPQKNQLLNLIEQLNLKDRVILLGYSTDFPSCISNASLFVLSSDYEGMPNVLIEAMALGLPCIATDCPSGGPKFLIDPGVNGLLVPINNSAKLAEAIDFILSNKKLSEKIGFNARKITKILNSEKIYKKWERYIYQIMEL